jgi:hypothetical protein
MFYPSKQLLPRLFVNQFAGHLVNERNPRDPIPLNLGFSATVLPVPRVYSHEAHH